MSAIATLALWAALRADPSPPRGGSARAVLAALAADEQIARFALWRDRLPAGASGVLAGPALAAARASATQRRARDLHIRLVSSQTDVLSLRLSAGGSRASVVVTWSQRLLPVLPGGRRGRPIEVVEEAALALRRLPGSPRFAVWDVEEIR